MHVVVSRLRILKKNKNFLQQMQEIHAWFAKDFLCQTRHISSPSASHNPDANCTSQPQANPTEKDSRSSVKPARRGAPGLSVLLRNSFAHSTSARQKTTANSRSAEPIPDPTTTALAEGRAPIPRSSSLVRFSRSVRPGVYHNTAVVFNDEGKLVGKYRKMHIPDDPLYYETFYFAPRGISGFNPSRPNAPNIGTAYLLGPNGIPRARGSPR